MLGEIFDPCQKASSAVMLFSLSISISCICNVELCNDANMVPAFLFLVDQYSENISLTKKPFMISS